MSIKNEKLLYGGQYGDQQISISEIEPGVRSTVIELNRCGQHTLMSCHGHAGRKTHRAIKTGNSTRDDEFVQETVRGWITFNAPSFNRPLVVSILKKHGFQRVRFSVPSRDVSVTFTRRR